MNVYLVFLLAVISASSTASSVYLQRRDDTPPAEEKCNEAFEELVMKEAQKNMGEVMKIVNAIKTKIDEGEMPFEDFKKLHEVLGSQAGFAEAVKDVLTHLYDLKATKVDVPESCEKENIEKHKDDCKKMLVQLATCTVNFYQGIADEIKDENTSFMEKMQKIEGYEQAIMEEIDGAKEIIGGCVGDWYCMARKEKPPPNKRALISLLSSFVDKINEN